jgi:hypothetical protein
LTDEALAAVAPEAREALWAKAEGVCDAFVEGWPENPRKVLVEVQRALVLSARGGQARASHDLTAAVEHLRAATRKLATVGDEVGRELVERRLRSQNGSPPDALTVKELESLELHIAFQLARAERQTGLCHPLGSADRDDALLQALKRLAPIAQRSPPDELVWSARVELAECRRELGDGEVAERLVAAWMKENPPVRFRDLLSGSAQAQGAERPRGDSFQAGIAAAEAERQAGRLEAAAAKYQWAALEYPADRQAAEAHRQAILCVADLLRSSAASERDGLARSYVALIDEHLEHWAAQPTADEVRLWQAQLLAARQDYAAAIAVLQQVRSNSQAFAESVRLVAQCYDTQMRSINVGGGAATTERAQLLASATQFFQPIITGKENRWPESWSQLQRELAVDLARLHLRYSDPSSAYAEQLLTAAIRGSENADGDNMDTWRSTAQSLVIAALAQGGKVAEAQKVAKQLTNAPPDVLLETLETLDERVTEPRDGANRAAIGQLSLGLVQLVESRHTELDKDQLAKLDRCRAAALAATGDWAGAATQYAAIAAASPDDGVIQENYAAVLAQSDSPEHLRQALARWTEVERRSRRGGERWLRARRARIELFNRLGEQAEAEKLVKLTQLLYPEWDAAGAQ